MALAKRSIYFFFLCRINDLESGVERLRNQQEILKRKLKKQSGKKLQLEVGTAV